MFLHPPAASEAHYRKGLRRQMIRSNTIHTLVLEPTSIQCSSVKAVPCHVHNSRTFDTITPLHANSQRKRCFSDLVFLHPPTASEAHYRKGLRRQMIRSITIHTLVLEPTRIQCSSVKAVPCHVHNSRTFDTITPLHANSQRKRCFSDLVFLHPPTASEAHYRKGLRRQMIRSKLYIH